MHCTTRRGVAAATVALMAVACDPGYPDEHDLEIETPGTAGSSESGDDGGDDGGDDQAQVEFEEGAPQVCEVAEGVVYASERTIDDLTDVPGASLGADVACPKAGALTASYVDYRCEYNAWDGTAGLYCQYWYDCDVTYASPCNPPHADCGGPYHSHIGEEYKIGTSPFGMWQCHIQGPLHCRANTGKAAERAVGWCIHSSDSRTRECPDCPPKP